MKWQEMLWIFAVIGVSFMLLEEIKGFILRGLKKDSLISRQNALAQEMKTYEDKLLYQLSEEKEAVSGLSSKIVQYQKRIDAIIQMYEENMTKTMEMADEIVSLSASMYQKIKILDELVGASSPSPESYQRFVKQVKLDADFKKEYEAACDRYMEQSRLQYERRLKEDIERGREGPER